MRRLYPASSPVALQQPLSLHYLLISAVLFIFQPGSFAAASAGKNGLKCDTPTMNGFRIDSADLITGTPDSGDRVMVAPGKEVQIRIFGCDMASVTGVKLVESSTDCSGKSQIPPTSSFTIQREHTLVLKVGLPKSAEALYFCLKGSGAGGPDPSASAGSGNGTAIASGTAPGQNGTSGTATADKGYVLQDTSLSISLQHKPKKYYLPMPFQIAIIAVLLVLSGLFSGLNLGLMALDKNELLIVMKAGKPNEKRYAETIYPIRKMGNYLLCSLLLGNVFVNAAISILFDDLTSGLLALFASSFGIVVFGEIVPQSVCSRYGLAVGAQTIWLTRLFMILTAPLSWPISKILDCVLGEEVGQVYNKERLLELIRRNAATIEGDEVAIVSGALQLSNKSVGEVMTLVRDMYMVPHDAVLDTKTVAEVVHSGYTRIPVVEQGVQPKNKVVGLLNVKDLALLDPDDKIPVNTVCQFYRHHLREVYQEMPLLKMLDEFKSGKSHIAFVVSVVSSESGDPYNELVGCVTLEDIIEEIIQAEIVDETDIITDNRRRIPRQNPQRFDMTALVNESGKMISSNGGLPSGLAEQSYISPQLVVAAFQHLVATMEPFKEKYISEHVLQRLIRQNVIRMPAPDPAKGHQPAPLYENGKPADYFVLLLEGHMNVVIGQEHNVFDAGPFHSFGRQVLEAMAGVAPRLSITAGAASMSQGSRKYTFTPDFTAKFTEAVTYLQINTGAYLKAYRATLIEKSKGTDPEQIRTLLANLGGSSFKEAPPPSSIDRKESSRSGKKLFSRDSHGFQKSPQKGAAGSKVLNQVKRRLSAGSHEGRRVKSPPASMVYFPDPARKTSDSKVSSEPDIQQIDLDAVLKSLKQSSRASLNRSTECSFDDDAPRSRSASTADLVTASAPATARGIDLDASTDNIVNDTIENRMRTESTPL